MRRHTGEAYLCQVDDCDARLSSLRAYNIRYRVCPAHLCASSVNLTLPGCQKAAHCRFCQQCGKFHRLEEFDGVKKSCRFRLHHHNKSRQQRRREAAQHHSSPPAAGAPQQPGARGLLQHHYKTASNVAAKRRTARHSRCKLDVVSAPAPPAMTEAAAAHSSRCSNSAQGRGVASSTHSNKCTTRKLLVQQATALERTKQLSAMHINAEFACSSLPGAVPASLRHRSSSTGSSSSRSSASSHLPAVLPPTVLSTDSADPGPARLSHIQTQGPNEAFEAHRQVDRSAVCSVSIPSTVAAPSAVAHAGKQPSSGCKQQREMLHERGLEALQYVDMAEGMDCECADWSSAATAGQMGELFCNAQIRGFSGDGSPSAISTPPAATAPLAVTGSNHLSSSQGKVEVACKDECNQGLSTLPHFIHEQWSQQQQQQQQQRMRLLAGASDGHSRTAVPQLLPEPAAAAGQVCSGLVATAASLAASAASKEGLSFDESQKPMMHSVRSPFHSPHASGWDQSSHPASMTARDSATCPAACWPFTVSGRLAVAAEPTQPTPRDGCCSTPTCWRPTQQQQQQQQQSRGYSAPTAAVALQPPGHVSGGLLSPFQELLAPSFQSPAAAATPSNSVQSGPSSEPAATATTYRDAVAAAFALASNGTGQLTVQHDFSSGRTTEQSKGYLPQGHAVLGCQPLPCDAAATDSEDDCELDCMGGWWQVLLSGAQDNPASLQQQPSVATADSGAAGAGGSVSAAAAATPSLLMCNNQYSHMYQKQYSHMYQKSHDLQQWPQIEDPAAKADATEDGWAAVNTCGQTGAVSQVKLVAPAGSTVGTDAAQNPYATMSTAASAAMCSGPLIQVEALESRGHPGQQAAPAPGEQQHSLRHDSAFKGIEHGSQQHSAMWQRGIAAPDDSTLAATAPSAGGGIAGPDGWAAGTTTDFAAGSGVAPVGAAQVLALAAHLQRKYLQQLAGRTAAVLDELSSCHATGDAYIQPAGTGRQPSTPPPPVVAGYTSAAHTSAAASAGGGSAWCQDLTTGTDLQQGAPAAVELPDFEGPLPELEMQPEELSSLLDWAANDSDGLGLEDLLQEDDLE